MGLPKPWKSEIKPNILREKQCADIVPLDDIEWR
jgi:hypothetical protein